MHENSRDEFEVDQRTQQRGLSAIAEHLVNNSITLSQIVRPLTMYMTSLAMW